MLYEKILIMGLSYKKNIGDIRFSPSITLIDKLLKYSLKVDLHDPILSGYYKNNL